MIAPSLQKILVTDIFTPDSLATLRQHFRVAKIQISQLPQPTSEELKDTEALMIRSRTCIQKDFLEQCPNLKIIITATSGFDHIDLSTCTERNIVVMFTPEANGISVSELTFGLIFSLLRSLNDMKKTIKDGHWKNSLQWGRELYGQKLGIFGLGRIGRRVAQIAHCFGMHVSAYDPYQIDEVFEASQVERVALSEILIDSDIVSLHVPLTHETKHLINYQTLGIINNDAIIVNTSRGAVINELDLINALERKKIVGACLDVFEKEPLPVHSKLLSLSNVVVSCHVGAFTEAAFKRASNEAVQKLITWSKTGKTSDTLPISASWIQSPSY